MKGQGGLQCPEVVAAGDARMQATKRPATPPHRLGSGPLLLLCARVPTQPPPETLVRVRVWVRVRDGVRVEVGVGVRIGLEVGARVGVRVGVRVGDRVRARLVWFQSRQVRPRFGLA